MERLSLLVRDLQNVQVQIFPRTNTDFDNWLYGLEQGKISFFMPLLEGHTIIEYALLCGHNEVALYLMHTLLQRYSRSPKTQELLDNIANLSLDPEVSDTGFQVVYTFLQKRMTDQGWLEYALTIMCSNLHFMKPLNYLPRFFHLLQFCDCSFRAVIHDMTLLHLAVMYHNQPLLDYALKHWPELRDVKTGPIPQTALQLAFSLLPRNHLAITRLLQ